MIDGDKLRNRAHALLMNRPRTLTIDKIAADTGLAATWLHAFAQNRAMDVSARRVVILFEYLSGRPLNLD